MTDPALTPAAQEHAQERAELRKEHTLQGNPLCKLCGARMVETRVYTDFVWFACPSGDKFICSRRNHRIDPRVIRALDDLERAEAENDLLFMQAARDAVEITDLKAELEVAQIWRERWQSASKSYEREVSARWQAETDRDASNRAFVACQNQVIEREKVIEHLYWNVLRDRQQGDLCAEARSGDEKAQAVLAVVCPDVISDVAAARAALEIPNV